MNVTDYARLREIEERRKQALEMIHDLCIPKGCEGSRNWIMSIPARPDHDPDLVIAALLADIDFLLSLVREQRWVRDVPTEQGDYWHWSGNPDDAPSALDVMWSGAAQKCFVCGKDMDGSPWCDEVGGWWKKIPLPAPPEEKEQRG